MIRLYNDHVNNISEINLVKITTVENYYFLVFN